MRVYQGENHRGHGSNWIVRIHYRSLVIRLLSHNRRSQHQVMANDHAFTKIITNQDYFHFLWKAVILQFSKLWEKNFFYCWSDWDNECVYSFMLSIDIKLRPYSWVVSEFSTCTNPPFHSHIIRSMNYELICGWVVCCGCFNCLCIWSMAKFSQCKAANVIEFECSFDELFVLLCSKIHDSLSEQIESNTMLDTMRWIPLVHGSSNDSRDMRIFLVFLIRDISLLVKQYKLSEG